MSEAHPREQQPHAAAADPVLLLEDDWATRRALGALLRVYGYEVIEAASVAQALAKADGQAFAILDLNLPDGLGLRVLEHFRRTHPGTRVAIISASADDRLLEEVERQAPDAFLPKPIDVDRLLGWLREGTG